MATTLKDNATAPIAAENDIAAEVAELRTAVTNLIEDREELQAALGEAEDRIAKLESAGGAGVSYAPIDRELGKVRRSLEYLRDASFPRMPLDAYETMSPPEEAPVGSTAGDSTGAQNGPDTGDAARGTAADNTTATTLPPT